MQESQFLRFHREDLRENLNTVLAQGWSVSAIWPRNGNEVDIIFLREKIENDDPGGPAQVREEKQAEKVVKGILEHGRAKTATNVHGLDDSGVRREYT